MTHGLVTQRVKRRNDEVYDRNVELMLAVGEKLETVFSFWIWLFSRRRATLNSTAFAFSKNVSSAKIDCTIHAAPVRVCVGNAASAGSTRTLLYFNT